MPKISSSDTPTKVRSLEDLAKAADYSLLEKLNCDPQATESGEDFAPRQVFSGHYVPVKPTPIAHPQYVAHSEVFFRELGFDDDFAHTDAFKQFFSGDTSALPKSMNPYGWATGYALSIYGTEYTQQCPFRTGNGYGDGRAISVLEAVLNGQRWEMQLKGGGPTPYCRGADGRAVFRSSIREFVAQEYMHALGVPTSRSLSLFVSETERVNRPWYSEGSYSMDPDIMVSNPVAISTRVAPSFLRVGQIELFGRRARKNEHPNALSELKLIVEHVIEREYRNQIDANLAFTDKVVLLAIEFRERLTSLIAHWMRVGYCQGNFNSDNCACGGYTLDYGPFGFCERFDPYFQPWTGGGRHFSFFNQSAAAQTNFIMFCKALEPLLTVTSDALKKLHDVRDGFSSLMQDKLEKMWTAKLGLNAFDHELYTQLFQLMMQSSVDYTIFFRELSKIPSELSELKKSFYEAPSQALSEQWQAWLTKWRSAVLKREDPAHVSEKMKRVNPKFTWREWLVVPAYKQAMEGDYSLLHELREVLNNPYEEQSAETEQKFYQLRPQAFFDTGGVSHYSCSS
uniref:protein adenylyltransferase SelO n=1 Tax=Ningiella ruwaisensis TaxID=2364274 RepID=UPI0010A0A9EC|nr:protein adenylyltransferase SelO family protein [Ningiella ruwaisensis]